MLFSINHLITDIVIFDNILEASVIPQKSKLNDVITKLLPLHGLIAIDIDFFEKVDEGKCESKFQFGVISIVVEMFEHD